MLVFARGDAFDLQEGKEDGSPANPIPRRVNLQFLTRIKRKNKHTETNIGVMMHVPHVTFVVKQQFYIRDLIISFEIKELG
jgi:hypothetical protein